MDSRGVDMEKREKQMREIKIDLADIRVVDGYLLRTALLEALVEQLTYLQNLSDEVCLFCDSDYNSLYRAYGQFVDAYSYFWNVCVLLDSLALFSAEGVRKLFCYLAGLSDKTFNAYHSCF